MTLKVEVYTPEGKVLSGEFDGLFAVAENGDVGILPGHSPFLASLRENGKIRLKRGASERSYSYHSGLLEVRPELTILLLSTFSPL